MSVAAARLSRHLAHLATALDATHTAAVATALAATPAAFSVDPAVTDAAITSACAFHLPPGWADVAAHHLRVLRDLPANPALAFAHQLALIRDLLRLLSDRGRPWLPVLYVAARDTAALARHALHYTASNHIHPGTPGAHQGRAPDNPLEDAARWLHRALITCLNDRDHKLAKSRKWGTYRILAHLFAAYFALGQPTSCDSVLRVLAAANKDIPPLVRFPRAHQVAYRYQLGLLALTKEKYPQAEIDLAFALTQCHPAHRRNKERILRHLIPVRMLLGRLPHPQHLASYSPSLAHLYLPLASAIRQGRPAQYHRLLRRHEPLLLRLGVFLVLERAAELALRSLFRRTWLILRRLHPDQASRVSFDYFEAACRAEPWPDVVRESHAHHHHDHSIPSHAPIDPDAVECLLATTVAAKLIRGYLSHERRVVVLSKLNPFPRVSDVMQAMAQEQGDVVMAD